MEPRHNFMAAGLVSVYLEQVPAIVILGLTRDLGF